MQYVLDETMASLLTGPGGLTNHQDPIPNSDAARLRCAWTPQTKLVWFVP